jgi:hypothetical protein
MGQGDIMTIPNPYFFEKNESAIFSIAASLLLFLPNFYNFFRPPCFSPKNNFSGGCSASGQSGGKLQAQRPGSRTP